jgi:hypothetical protein
MSKLVNISGLMFAMVLGSKVAVGGIVDPDCTAEKAARGAAMKATVGVGNRCSPAEAAKDTARDTVGIEKKGPLEKRRDDDGPLQKVRDRD